MGSGRLSGDIGTMSSTDSSDCVVVTGDWLSPVACGLVLVALGGLLFLPNRTCPVDDGRVELASKIPKHWKDREAGPLLSR